MSEAEMRLARRQRINQAKGRGGASAAGLREETRKLEVKEW